jgi:hypothetical protein
MENSLQLQQSKIKLIELINKLYDNDKEGFEFDFKDNDIIGYTKNYTIGELDELIESLKSIQRYNSKLKMINLSLKCGIKFINGSHMFYLAQINDFRNTSTMTTVDVSNINKGDIVLYCVYTYSNMGFIPEFVNLDVSGLNFDIQEYMRLNGILRHTNKNHQIILNDKGLDNLGDSLLRRLDNNKLYFSQPEDRGEVEANSMLLSICFRQLYVKDCRRKGVKVKQWNNELSDFDFGIRKYYINDREIKQPEEDENSIIFYSKPAKKVEPSYWNNFTTLIKELLRIKMSDQLPDNYEEKIRELRLRARLIYNRAVIIDDIYIQQKADKVIEEVNNRLKGETSTIINNEIDIILKRGRSIKYNSPLNRRILTLPNLKRSLPCREREKFKMLNKRETLLGTSIPPEYIKYVKRFGHISFDHHKWTGLNTPDPELNVVEKTIMEKIKHPNFPEDAVVLEDLGRDGLILLSENGGVYRFEKDQSLQRISDSMVEYLDEIIRTEDLI